MVEKHNTAGVAAFDVDRALAGVDRDEELLREVLGLFLEDAPRLLEQLHAAVTADAAEDIARAAHTLKGSVSVFGAAPAAAAALRLEEIGRSGDARGAAAAWADLEHEFGRLLPELETWFEGA